MIKNLNCHQGLRLTHLLFFGGLGLMVVSLMMNGKGVMPFFGVVIAGILGLGCVIAGIIVCGLTVKCPHCGKFLNRSGKIPRSIPKFCPMCGEKL